MPDTRLLLRGLGYGLALTAAGVWWVVAIDWATGNWGLPGFLVTALGVPIAAGIAWSFVGRR